MHQRRNIRDAIVAALGGISANVTVGIVYPEQPENLPAVNVLTGDETVTDDQQVMATTLQPALYQIRELVMQFECRALVDPLDDALDALALEVEQALGVDVTLGGAADRIVYSGCSTDREGDLEAPAGVLTLDYQVFYRVNARDPQANEG